METWNGHEVWSNNKAGKESTIPEQSEMSKECILIGLILSTRILT